MENSNKKQSQESLDELRDLQSDEFLAEIPSYTRFTKPGHKDLIFILVCVACPEKYIVEDDETGLEIACITFRMGKFKVMCPDMGDEVVLEKTFSEPFQGCFYSEQERQDNLQKAAEAIWKYYERKDDGL